MQLLVSMTTMMDTSLVTVWYMQCHNLRMDHTGLVANAIEVATNLEEDTTSLSLNLDIGIGTPPTRVVTGDTRDRAYHQCISQLIR